MPGVRFPTSPVRSEQNGRRVAGFLRILRVAGASVNCAAVSKSMRRFPSRALEFSMNIRKPGRNGTQSNPMEPFPAPAPKAPALLASLRAFLFPHGEDAARQVRAVKVTERGEFRAAPNARWIPYTAENVIQATCSGFRWDARLSSGIRLTGVTDAYENGHGRLVVKAGCLIPVKKATGPEFDIGELQRYLASPPLMSAGAAEPCSTRMDG